MAVKTITIDMEAYEALSRRKRNNQSFSQVIKEHFGPAKTGRDLATALAHVKVENETIEATEAQIAARRKNRARAVRW
jgi:predicted CopG family antitoxin